MMKYPNRISVCKKNCSKIKWDQCLSTTLSKTESHTRVVYRQKPSPFHFAPMLINQQLSAVSTHTRTDTKAYRQTHSSLSLKCVLNWAGKWGWVTWSPFLSPRGFFTAHTHGFHCSTAWKFPCPTVSWAPPLPAGTFLHPAISFPKHLSIWGDHKHGTASVVYMQIHI